MTLTKLILDAKRQAALQLLDRLEAAVDEFWAKGSPDTWVAKKDMLGLLNDERKRWTE